MAYAVLIGTAPGTYVHKRDAEAAYFTKQCATVTEAEAEAEDEDQMPIVVYTDGACSNNGKATAKAGVGVFWGDGHPKNVSRPVHGVATNNVAELEAVEDALDAIADMRPLRRGGFRIATDSQYAIQCVTTWFDGWRARGWKTASGSPVKNIDLIRRIHDKLDALGTAVALIHVRGHSGVPGNEAADRLAVCGAGL